MNKALKRSIYVSLAFLSISGLAGTISSNSVSAKRRVRYTRRARFNRRSKRSYGHNRVANLHVSASGSLKSLAKQKYSHAMKIAKKHPESKAIMKADSHLGRPFSQANYEAEYMYALSHPTLIKGAQGGTSTGTPTGELDGLSDYDQYQAMLATKRYARQHHLSSAWVKKETNVTNPKTFGYWFFYGFKDVAGGNDTNDARHDAGKKGIVAYHMGLNKASHAKNAKVNHGLIKYTKSHLNNTIFNIPY